MRRTHGLAVASIALACAWLVASGLALAAAASPSGPADGRSPDVTVEFAPLSRGNPDRGLEGATDVAGKMKRLSRFVSEDARPHLAAGDRLSVRFEEVVLAGSLEPWSVPRQGDVRFVSPQYPPRITLSFRWTGADGAVVREGTRRLTDLDFQRDPRAALSNDPLRYERALLDGWIERELSSR